MLTQPEPFINCYQKLFNKCRVYVICKAKEEYLEEDVVKNKKITAYFKSLRRGRMPDNVENMFYVGEEPWHKKGIKLDSPPTSEEAIRLAGLNWNVQLADLFTKNKVKANGYYGVQRMDNNNILGVVGNGYRPLQNSKAFEFFDPLINEKYADYETAGAIDDGKIIWILVKINKESKFDVLEGDTIEKFLLLSNSHDGSSSVSIKFTPIRVVCQNTLNYALSQGETTKIRHVYSMDKKMIDLAKTILPIDSVYKNIEKLFVNMSTIKLKSKQVDQYFESIYPIKKEDNETDSKRQKHEQNIKIVSTLKKYHEAGAGSNIVGVKGSLWGAYNAVTEFIDHPPNYKLGDIKLLKRIWFGEGEQVKRKALEEAKKLLKVG